MVGSTLILALAIVVTACTGSEKHKVSEPLAADKKEGKSIFPSEVARLPPEQCKTFSSETMSIPIYVARGHSGILITRVTKPCVTRDGLRGYEKGTSWVAMGIPCTGGRGRIDITGKNYNPMMLTFFMSTDCLTAPQSIDDVLSIASTAGFDAQSKLLAYNPLAVQYWEVVGFADTDAGFKVELRSEAMIRGFWNDFKAHTKKLRVKIYGRENAWVQDDRVYVVEGNFIFEAPMNFRFEVLSAHELDEAERATARAKCEALKQKRDCTEIF